jgi:cytochrome c oxidase cbb3-type subunit 2
MDIKNRPDPPYDFTVTARFKSGYTNRDLYRAYMTGLDGSPMPSFADKLTPDQAWDLVHFTRTLQVKRKSEERRVLEAAGGRNALEKYQP